MEPVAPTPREILEYQKGRIAELEVQLADALRRSENRRRLQDLTPEELAMEAVGASGEIVKAARLQAQELRESAIAEALAVRSEAKRILAEANSRSEVILAEAQGAAKEALDSAQSSTKVILTEVRSESDVLVREATERAKALWTTALADSDRLGQEAQARLQAAVATADQSIASAKGEAAEIVRNAQREGRDLVSSPSHCATSRASVRPSRRFSKRLPPFAQRSRRFLTMCVTQSKGRQRKHPRPTRSAVPTLCPSIRSAQTSRGS
jgi:vacuolar-type H+-ATPase subunit H